MMIQQITQEIHELQSMKKYPETIYYKGNKELLHRKKISIVGTRRPSSYTKDITAKISKTLSEHGATIISGGAMGVDAIAHQNANSTISVLANGLDIYYPAVNKNLLKNIEMSPNGLLLSTYPEKMKARSYHFVQRNEIVVALGEALIVTQADENSGTLRSVEFALKMNRPIYVVPHRMHESKGTNLLLEQNKAEAIYSIDSLITKLGLKSNVFKETKSEFLQYCENIPNYDDAVSLYHSEVFEEELMGNITIKNGKIYPN